VERPFIASEGLLEVLGEVCAALFHFNEDFGFPDEVGEGGAAFGVFEAELEGCAGFEDAGLAEGAEEVVEEDLGLAFFVAFDVSGGPGDEVAEALLAGVVHVGLRRDRRHGQNGRGTRGTAVRGANLHDRAP
jgi:hypothetical protein